VKPLAVLRPEPGNAATAARIAAEGGRAIRLPLFAVRPLPWTAPDPAAYDALLVTSANAIRAAGPQLATLAGLPTYVVGTATAEAATTAGLRVEMVGDADGTELAERAVRVGMTRALHLAGRDRAVATLPGVARVVEVYASEPTAIDPAALAALHGAVALVHSPRAGARLAELATDPGATALAAISARAAAAAGEGWAAVAIAAQPDDAGVVAAGLALA
jgi:uroporphyrinogen-III synthase